MGPANLTGNLERMTAWRTSDYLRTLAERGQMNDLDLAALMGVGTDEVRIALRGPIQRRGDLPADAR